MTTTHSSEAVSHTPQTQSKSGLILGLMFLGWVVALIGAFAVFGLGAFIMVGTVTSWGILALLLVMTAGG